MSINFEITNDREFLKKFWDAREIFKFSPEVVEKLRSSDDPYGKYGYGQWLYRVRPDGDESVIQAQQCFEYASENGVADARQMLSYMRFMGDYYNEDKGGIWEKSNVMALILNAQAQEEGSELALLRRNIDLFYGNIVPPRREAAIEEAIEKMKDSDVPYLWLDRLGGFYESEGRTEDSKEAYEKCIAAGFYEPIYDLALLYQSEGDNYKYDALMQEGIEKGVAECHIWGIEYESLWDALPDERKQELHERLKNQLERGVELGGSFCAYILAWCKQCGTFGFERDIQGALEAAYKGVALHSMLCCNVVIEIMTDQDIRDEIPEEMLLDEEDFAMIALKALRYGDNDKLPIVMNCREEYEDMGYAEEMHYWSLYQKDLLSQATEQTADADEDDKVEEKTEIEPAVLVIHPSGYTEFLDADVNAMSPSEMAAIIEAEGLDAVHYSENLSKITKECHLDKNVCMYVDKNAIMKGLEDNAAASILYGHGYEVRGAVIIALEDKKYDTCSFNTEEDIENVFEAIDDLTGLLRRETDDTGQYDPWA